MNDKAKAVFIMSGLVIALIGIQRQETKTNREKYTPVRYVSSYDDCSGLKADQKRSCLIVQASMYEGK